MKGFLLFFYLFSERMMSLSKTEPNFMEHLKPLLPAGGDASELEAAAQALAGLSPEDRDLLAAVQESPYRLTTLEQFREFPANTEYFVLEPNIRKVEDVGWRYLAQHLDVLLPPELLDAIDPVPFGKYAMQEEQGCFTSRGYLTLSGDEWQHEQCSPPGGALLSDHSGKYQIYFLPFTPSFRLGNSSLKRTYFPPVSSSTTTAS